MYVLVVGWNPPKKWVILQVADGSQVVAAIHGDSQPQPSAIAIRIMNNWEHEQFSPAVYRERLTGLLCYTVSR